MVVKSLCHRLLRICSVCRRQMPFFLSSSFMISTWFSTWATRWVPIMKQELLIFPFVQSFVFILYYFCNGIVCLFICCSPCHCIYVCPSSIYSFWLSLWYLQNFVRNDMLYDISFHEIPKAEYLDTNEKTTVKKNSDNRNSDNRNSDNRNSHTNLEIKCTQQ